MGSMSYTYTYVTRIATTRVMHVDAVCFSFHAHVRHIDCLVMIIIILRPSTNARTIDCSRQQEMKMMLGKVAVFYCSWLLALSVALPAPLGIQPEVVRTPRSGFATAKHALIIGCDGFGKNYCSSPGLFQS